jgi:hypothetical protein
MGRDSVVRENSYLRDYRPLISEDKSKFVVEKYFVRAAIAAESLSGRMKMFEDAGDSTKSKTKQI